ncbi:MAG: hypothetical protein AVDCRST_MAG89-3375, partial [uncultured Gemmatimonadetes bacterium]
GKRPRSRRHRGRRRRLPGGRGDGVGGGVPRHQPRDGDHRRMAPVGLQLLRPVAGPASGRDRAPLLQRPQPAGLAPVARRDLHRLRGDPDEPGHLLPAHLALQHPDDAGPADGRHRPGGALAAALAV